METSKHLFLALLLDRKKCMREKKRKKEGHNETEVKNERKIKE
jgi:hypothetical protein